MLRRILKLTHFCTSSATSAALTSTNLAFKATRDPSISQKITTQFQSNPQQKQKLDALAKVILSLPNLQIQYLLALQNQNRLAKGQKITDSMVINTGQQKLNAIQYLYQKKWLHDVWKQYHIMTSLFSSEGDKQGVQQIAAVTKQIYEFQLTSIDAAQKIKIIKVIRELLGLGLKEAKDIVDKVPTIMKKGKKQQGEKLKQELAKNGCVMTLK